MADVFDLDAFQADAAGEPFRWRFGGQEFLFPPKPDVRTVGAMAEGQILGPLRELLGDQFDRFSAIRDPFDEQRFAALFAAYEAHMGVATAGG